MNQESVWDYPRPPKVEVVEGHLRVEFGGEIVAEAEHAYRVLETSHPPTYYIPRERVRSEFLEAGSGSSFCEFKGSTTYWTLRVGDRVSRNAGWSYERPSPGFEAIRGHISFYASRVDVCYVNGERVEGQAGDFYGGWITSGIVGPFKGGPGSAGW